MLDISSAWIIGPNVLTGQLIENINEKAAEEEKQQRRKARKK